MNGTAATTDGTPRHADPDATENPDAGDDAMAQPERLGSASLADIDRMSPLFERNARVLVVGGGYIGLEAAAVAAKLGLRVTLVEMAERILGRVAAPETADFFCKAMASPGE